ncbi:MAG: 30S ribosome-binding factor RbfA [Candidatus Dadabacteria bacterium]|nr:MAG: 30S ribosome-binding factor RbfA [Candidatus Dadabacteria bacterium]
METRRTRRVADLLHHEIAWVLERELKDPRVGFVTVTGVKVSADLRHARVYYTVLGDEAQRAETQRGLDSARAFVRRAVGMRMRIKVVPDLKFVYDEAFERGLRTQAAIEDIADDAENPDR